MQQTKRCASCGHISNAEARFCQNCGGSQFVAPMVLCAACGTLVPQDHYCAHCGADLVNPNAIVWRNCSQCGSLVHITYANCPRCGAPNLPQVPPNVRHVPPNRASRQDHLRHHLRRGTAAHPLRSLRSKAVLLPLYSSSQGDLCYGSLR